LTAADITEFTGEYRFLSNFYASPVTMRLGLAELTFPTSEHAFQASKAVIPGHVMQPGVIAIRDADTAREAKRMGRAVMLRPDWDQVKKQVMLEILLAKFTQNSGIRASLLATAPARLTEGNRWHDNYWGQCFCVRCDPYSGHKEVFGTEHPAAVYPHPGHNYLGRLLMAARDVLTED
jgi:ribA/ribD-fused uncharacterized protein